MKVLPGVKRSWNYCCSAAKRPSASRVGSVVAVDEPSVLQVDRQAKVGQEVGAKDRSADVRDDHPSGEGPAEPQIQDQGMRAVCVDR